MVKTFLNLKHFKNHEKKSYIYARRHAALGRAGCSGSGASDPSCGGEQDGSSEIRSAAVVLERSVSGQSVHMEHRLPRRSDLLPDSGVQRGGGRRARGGGLRQLRVRRVLQESPSGSELRRLERVRSGVRRSQQRCFEEVVLQEVSGGSGVRSHRRFCVQPSCRQLVRSASRCTAADKQAG